MLEGDVLESAFGNASPTHFAWQTAAPGVAERERALVRAAFEPLGSRLLDLGCGEGATLLNLNEPAGATGVDLFPEKIEFARKRLPRCRFECASVYELPFENESFDHLLVRDLIHHLDEPDCFMREAKRVLSSRGRIDVLEPCRYNPLVLAHALAIRAERGELRSTTNFVRKLVARNFEVTLIETFQALPIHRLVFHFSYGRPAWGQSGLVRRVVDTMESLAEVLVPRWARAYIHVRAVKS